MATIKTTDDNFCEFSIFFTQNLLKFLFAINKADILNGIKQHGFFIPDVSHRKKVYGNIAVSGEKRDFQYSPNW